MDSTKTLTVHQVRPVASKRTSIKVSEEPNNSPDNLESSLSSNNHYTNIDLSDVSTRSEMNSGSRTDEVKSSQVRLLIANEKQDQKIAPSDQDSYLTTLINEFQISLNKKDCDNLSCYRFKLISYRISQSLFDRINGLKRELKTYSSKSKKQLTEEQPDNDDLMDVISQKDKRILELEKLVEDQRRLRLQDASQVEEKAAKIKEWVANKLEQLELQNRQLREHNRRQKESVKTLVSRLDFKDSQSTTDSCPKLNHVRSNVPYIDRASPVDTIDLDKSLDKRRPQLKQSSCSLTSSVDNNRTLCNRSTSNLVVPITCKLDDSGVTHESRPSMRHESPIYDSVFDQVHLSNAKFTTKSKISNDDQTEPIPPPPPLHRTDRWEQQLYSLADKTFSYLLMNNEDFIEGEENNNFHDSTGSGSRKSSLRSKSDLFSVVKPSFTTIDGDDVIEENNPDKNSNDDQTAQSNILIESKIDESSPLKLNIHKIRKDSLENSDTADSSMSPNLFNSPARSRTAKDSVLRTQSVRRNFTSEKLFDFISADFIKRGFLIKSGALKNHNRWFVLKNFHLYSYKTESEETEKAAPNMKIKIDPNCQVISVLQTSESSYPFKLFYSDKTLHLVANTAKIRDEWIKMLSCAISLSDIDPNSLTKSNSKYEGILTLMLHGHMKRCYAVLIGHILFFLKSFTDPSPVSYISMKGARIREITDSHDNNFEDHKTFKHIANSQECSLAIYPEYTLNTDPIYIASGEQRETDKWFYILSMESGVDQSHGTPYERSLTRIMINNSISEKGGSTSLFSSLNNDSSRCIWKDHSIMLYTDQPIAQPLTSLTNEALRSEAIEIFKSILLFTQVPLEPVAIDYHVCLLQNCLGQFLRYPELRNEFFAQLIKQCTYVLHKCGRHKLSCSSSSSSGSPIEQGSNLKSLSNSSIECRFITDVQLLRSIGLGGAIKLDTDISSNHLNNSRERNSFDTIDDPTPPSQSELLQVMQILAVAVSLNLPKGRMRWWLIDHLNKFANPETEIGRYALYTLKAIDRTTINGFRDNISSRMEIMSILLRNPYDHSSPHSLPISFANGTYVVVEADGSTTVDEFLNSMGREVNIRNSMLSDFYLFADDPSGHREVHILEPQRKIMDVIGWWEQTFRRHNSGRYQNTRAIRLICKKRLPLKEEEGETQQERLLIVHQINQEIFAHRIPLDEALRSELGAIMAQLVCKDFDESWDTTQVKTMLGKILSNPSSNRSSQSESNQTSEIDDQMDTQIIRRWKQLKGKSAQDCVRVYLNCIRRLSLVHQT